MVCPRRCRHWNSAWLAFISFANHHQNILGNQTNLRHKIINWIVNENVDSCDGQSKTRIFVRKKRSQSYSLFYCFNCSFLMAFIRKRKLQSENLKTGFSIRNGLLHWSYFSSVVASSGQQTRYSFIYLISFMEITLMPTQSGIF
jgi:hypothetical protein